jgi:hypothetical protein
MRLSLSVLKMKLTGEELMIQIKKRFEFIRKKKDMYIRKKQHLARIKEQNT